MPRNQQIKIKVSEEEKKQIERNAQKGGYANTATYIRNQCLNRANSTWLVYQKCEIRDSLQRISELSDNDSKIGCHIDRIHKVLDKAGDN